MLENWIERFTDFVVSHFERKYERANEMQFIGRVYMPLNTAFKGILTMAVGLIISLILFLVSLNNRGLMTETLIVFVIIVIFPALLTAYSLIMFAKCRMYYDSDGWKDTHVFKNADNYSYADIYMIEHREMSSAAFGNTLVIIHMNDGRRSCFSKKCYGGGEFYDMLLAKVDKSRVDIFLENTY